MRERAFVGSMSIYPSSVEDQNATEAGRIEEEKDGRLARLLSLWYYVRFALLFNFFFTSEHNILVNMQRLHK